MMGLSSAFWLRRIAQPLPRHFAISNEVFSPLNGTPPCSITMFTAISLEDAASSSPCPLTTSTICLRRPTFRARLLFASLRSTCVRAPCLRYRSRAETLLALLRRCHRLLVCLHYLFGSIAPSIACSNWGECITEFFHTIVPCFK